MSLPEGQIPDDSFIDLLTSVHEALTRDPSASMVARTAQEPALQARLARAEAVLRTLELDRRQRTEADAPPAGPPPGVAVDPDSGINRFGRFEVLGELGRGGFGIVLHAYDPVLQREVAVKVPRPEVLLAPALKRRLVSEAKAAAGLDHPNIVPLYEAGDHHGIPYLVSAYCSGPNLADWLSQPETRISWRQAANLVAQVAEAVAAIHERGIWHRDLKPSNILLQPREAAETAELPFVPRVTDFGLAKLTELQTVTTAQGARLGTLPYMAPEQASGCVEAIGPASDIYALGVILYELLAGVPPFKGRTDLETLQQMALQEPPSLRRFDRKLPRALETVCLKCLAREPGARYDSAAELATELRRVLAGMPIKARPVSPLARFTGLVRRHPITATLSLLCTVALLGLVMATLAWHRERTTETREMGHLHYVRRILDTQRLLETGDRSGVLKRLNALRPEPGQHDPRGFEWYHLWSLLRGPGILLLAHEQAVMGLACAPDGRTLATASQKGALALWDTSTWQPRQRWADQGAQARAVAFHPQGRLLAAGGTRWLALHETEGRRQSLAFPPNSIVINELAFLDDGQRLLGLTDTGLYLWAPAVSEQPQHLGGIPVGSTVLLPTPDGERCLVGGDDQITVYRVADGKQVLILDTPGHRTVALRLVDPDKLLSIGQDRRALLHDVHSGVCLEKIELDLPPGIDASKRISSGALTPDGRWYALAAEVSPTSEGLVWLRPLPSRILGGGAQPGTSSLGQNEVRTIPFIAGRVLFFPGSRDLVYSGGHGLVGVWPRDHAPNPRILSTAPEEAWGVAFTPDGQNLLLGCDNENKPECVRLVDSRTGQPLWQNTTPTKLVSAVAISPDGAVHASASYDGLVRLHDPATGRVLQTLVEGNAAVRCVAFSPDGTLIAAGSRGRTATVFAVATGEIVQRLTSFSGTVNGLAFLEGGRLLATVSGDGILRLHEARTGREVEHHRVSAEAMSVAVSPSGQHLAVGTREGWIYLEERGRGRRRMIEHGHRDEVFGLAFTPDGSRLASSGRDGLIRIWDVATGYELLTLRGHEKTVHSLRFSPDGRTLASASLDGTVRLWLAGE